MNNRGQQTNHFLCLIYYFELTVLIDSEIFKEPVFEKVTKTYWILVGENYLQSTEVNFNIVYLDILSEFFNMQRL